MFKIIPLSVGNDSRGIKLQIPDETFREFLPVVREMHIVSVEPGMIRGNHYHTHSNEVLIVQHRDDWLFAWTEDGKDVSSQQFSGQGATLFWLPAGLTHAVKNTGSTPLELLSCSNVEATEKNTCWLTILE
jgi:UDP-2-acetamido-2,6-beta-L-arabino-hexul-4-ose reductase